MTPMERRHFTAAAKRIGATVEEYAGHRALGELWCSRCRRWRPLQDFGSDPTRSTGYAGECRECASAKSHACYARLSAEGKAKRLAKQRAAYARRKALRSEPATGE